MTTSVIVPAVNRADLTRVCIDSILSYTSIPFELILVQEGVDSDISQLFQEYRGKAKLVYNETPKGFAGAMNSGLSVASGDYLCFLNNDTVVTPNWLDAMLSAFEDDKVGLVSPTTSEEGKQSINHNKGQELDYVDSPTALKGVCFLVKKEVLDTIGNWDERFGAGGGDDNDLCLRILKAGYKLAIARKSYIYHYGSATFRELSNNDIPSSHQYAVEQFDKFRDKHNIPVKPRVCISIATTGKIRAETTEWLLRTFVELAPNVEVHIVNDPRPLEHARNVQAQRFLSSYCTHLFLLDSDCVPRVGTIQRLVEYSLPIVSAPHSTMIGGELGVMLVDRRNGHYAQHQPIEGLQQVDAVGAGGLLIERHVLEEIGPPYFRFEYDGQGLLSRGEDFCFCEDAKRLGYEIWADCELVQRHVKELVI